MVNFRLIGPFVKIAGFKEKEIIIVSPQPLKTFEFITKFEHLYDRMIILVNGESATIETVVSNDDSVKILPVIGGG
jgi:sulfur carrier protein ThiS